MKLILVRHGSTEADSANRYWGQSDVVLSAAGLKQAERLRRCLSDERIDTIYTSTLQRAYQTAEIIAKGHKKKVIRCAELNEVNFGKIEGLTYEEICRLHPEVARLWACWSHELSFPEGESFDQFNSRVSKFLNRLEEHSSEETVLLVGHGGPFRLLVCHIMGLAVEHWWQFYFSLASISMLEIHDEGAILSQISDTLHLK